MDLLFPFKSLFFVIPRKDGIFLFFHAYPCSRKGYATWFSIKFGVVLDTRQSPIGIKPLGGSATRNHARP